MKNSAISLYELNSLVKGVLEDGLPEMVWIKAETSDVRQNQNGHCYLEFIEKDRGGKSIVAKSRAMIWANTYHLLKAYFEQTTKQSFSSGLKVLVQVSVEFHELYGISLTVHDIDPSYTLGDQAVNRAVILKQLEDEGVINLNKELELAEPSNRIAIISSPTAAGYEDFLDQLHNNPYELVFYTKLFPAIMQGDRAEDSIISALEHIYSHSQHFDAVVIIRGGGATSDLSSFDSYLLAANCAQFPLPIITGIGHERDETVLDIVAHTRAKTPTAVAEFLISNVLESLSQLDVFAQNIISIVRQRINDERQTLSIYESKNLFALKTWHKEQNLVLDTINTDLKRGLRQFNQKNQDRFSLMEMNLKKISKSSLDAEINDLNNISENLKKSIPKLINSKEDRLSVAEKQLYLLSPHNILKKGYTITIKNGKSVKSNADLKTGDTVQTIFLDGKSESVII